MHQNDQKSLSCEIQGGQKFIQSRDERPKKKKKKAELAKNPKGRSRQKLGPKKIRENGKILAN